MLNIIKLILSLLPNIISVMQELEKLFPQSGQGPVKLQLLKTALQGSYVPVDETMPTNDELWTKLLPIVGGVVQIFNASGEFKKE